MTRFNWMQRKEIEVTLFSTSNSGTKSIKTVELMVAKQPVKEFLFFTTLCRKALKFLRPQSIILYGVILFKNMTNEKCRQAERTTEKFDSLSGQTCLRQESFLLSWLEQPLTSGPKITFEMVFLKKKIGI